MPVQSQRLQKPAATSAIMRECAVCQSAIRAGEETQACPSCGLSFHSECWQENWGCSAYGCNQVNALKPADAKEPESQSAAEAEELMNELVAGSPFPWDYLILGFSAVAMIFSALTFGVPSMFALLAVITRFNFRDRIKSEMNVALLAISTAACAIGIIGGFFVSNFWWLSGR
jgi:hypothetical protein